MRSLLCTGRKRRKFLILDFLKRWTLHVSDHEMLLPFEGGSSEFIIDIVALFYFKFYFSSSSFITDKTRQ